MSRSINKEMTVSRTAVQSVVGLYDASTRPHYIGWHVRGKQIFALLKVMTNLLSVSAVYFDL